MPRLFDGWILFKIVTKTPTLNDICKSEQIYIWHAGGKISKTGSAVFGRLG
jgi:hypothetical protein